ncbi:MAG: serine hydrolase [Gammaproteobacteria bacterium]|nr:serine hydrolase [Gammaproteobacteria bacterium]MDE0415083.1 serine hydrolase [Gammaproteobacteria bacterium]MDE0454321.1 serine hydrolase [Gammaproteobacteria bacterium]
MTRRVIAALVVLIVAAIAADWTFWYRFATIRDQTSVTIPGWISPTATVEGDFRKEFAVVAPADRILSPGAIAELVGYAEQVDSFSLIVHHGGAIQFETYWREFGPDDVTETLSMAKSVLGLTFGFAVEDGSIGSIDDPVTAYIPEWEGTDKERLTIRHVLQMASGLEHFPFDYSLLQNPFNKALRLFVGPSMENAILRFELTAEPGSEFNYNSANTQLLLLILERATGRAYADYVSEKLWRPLGAKPATLWMDREGGMPKAYAFFQARPRDWLRIGLAIRNEGVVDGRQVIPAEWLTAMFSPSPNNPKYGLQAWIGSPHMTERFYNRNTPFGVKQAEPFLADDVVFFDGGGGQRVYVIPSADLVIVRTGMTSPDWDDGVIPNIILRDLGYGKDPS